MNSAICTPARSLALKPLAAAVLWMYAAGLQSAPVFQGSSGGSVTVSNPDSQTTVVTQEGSRAVANWQKFSIGANETVQFVQDNANSVILNRVTGEDISQILGNLKANGRVFLINPNGIVFGANAQVSVNGLVASTLSLKPDDMQSNSDEVGLTLNGPAASIVNNGQISAKDILLLAPGIENNGTLQGDGNSSKVQLIAADQVNVNTAEGSLVVQVAAGHENAVIQQLGTVMAEGGQIVLLARSSVGGQPSVINVASLNQATQIIVQGDSVRLGGDIYSAQGNTSLEVTARQVDQENPVHVAGDIVLNSDAVELPETQNDFAGTMTVNVNGRLGLSDSNQLQIQGVAAHAVLSGADVILGDLSTGRLDVSATRLSQLQDSAVRVEGVSTLFANRMTLDQKGNEFSGLVTLDVTSQAQLRSQGRLEVSGQTNPIAAGANLGSVSLTADEVILGPLGQLETLNVVADKVSQNSGLWVQKHTTLTVGKAELRHSSNDFVGEVLVRQHNSLYPDIEIADINSLTVRGDDLQLGAQIQGALTVLADNLVLGQSAVLGESQLILTGDLTQNGSVSLGNTLLSAGRVALNNSSNQFAGTVQIDSSDEVVLHASGDLNANVGASTATLMLNVSGSANLRGDHLRFAQSQFDKNLTVNAQRISQELAGTGSLEVSGNTELNALGGTINLMNSSNRFTGPVSATAEQTNIAAGNDLKLLNLNTRGGDVVANGRLFLLGNIEQTGGTLTFAAHGLPRPLLPAEIALLLPPTLDVFSAREAVNPITGLGRISLASSVIEQTSGQISTEAGSFTRFMALQNGSVVLTKENQINGQLGVLSGDRYSLPFEYLSNRGSSLFAVNNHVKLTVGAQGMEADLIAIRSRGLATEGQESQIRARMPYNDVGVGAARSYAGLTLSIPLNHPLGASSPVANFGVPSSNDSPGNSGAIRVEVGDVSRPGLGGFLTVVPFDGGNLLPGQVVYLAGPERNGMQAFFYDGARSLNRVPVVYNGSLLLSPQENAALTTAQGAVVLARQEQTRSVVRTENVTGKIINGVVVEVGPGRPATQGEGGAGKPSSCDAAEIGLACSP